jgi:hypothetical protein
MKWLIFVAVWLLAPSGPWDKAWAQAPTVGLAAQYDMMTITGGGTTLSDLSGNGENGTLHGTTTGSAGITFNGTSDYITLPGIVGDSDFTAVVCAQTASNNGVLWEENTASANQYDRLIRNQGTLNDGTNNNFTSSSGVPGYNNDWHCFILTRQQTQLTFSVLDMNVTQTIQLGNVATVSTVQGALGAQVWTGSGGGSNVFFAGTIGYVYIYKRALNPTEMSNLYAAIRTSLAARNVYMRDIVTPLYPGRAWQRQGIIINDRAHLLTEPKISYTTTDCQVLANPCFQLWYSIDNSSVHYAEATPDPVTGAPGAWALYGSAVATSHNQASVTKLTGFPFKYLMVATPGVTAGNALDVLTSNDPIHFSVAAAAAIPKGTGGQWDATAVFNSSVTQVGSTLYLTYEATGSGGGACGGATSTDGLTWTKSPANPITGFGEQNGISCGGPFNWYNAATNRWYLWTHDVVGTTGLYRRTASTFHSIWQTSSPNARQQAGGLNGSPLPILPPDAPDEATQMNSPYLAEVNGKTYMVYCASGPLSAQKMQIKLAIANMPLAQLVLTGEGEATPNP